MARIIAVAEMARPRGRQVEALEPCQQESENRNPKRQDGGHGGHRGCGMLGSYLTLPIPRGVCGEERE